MTWVAIDQVLGAARSDRDTGHLHLSGRLELAAIVLIALVGIWMRLSTISHDSLWIDEGHTLAAAKLSFLHLWTVPFDTHPPLHVTFVKLCLMILPEDLAVRVPSAIFSSATLGVVYLLARRLTGPFGGLVALAVIAFSYTLLVYSNVGRNYAQLVFFLSLACLSFQMVIDRLEAGRAWLDRGLLSWSAIYAVSALAALYTHNAAVLYLFALNAMGCFLIAARDRQGGLPTLIFLAGVNAVALLPWLPWLMVMLGGSGAFNWLEHKSVTQAAFILAATLGPNKTGLIGAALFFLVFFAGVLQASRRPSWLMAMIWFHLAIFPGFVWFIGYIIQPVYMERTILPVILSAALAVAAFATRTRPQVPAAAASGIALLISAASAMTYVNRTGTETALGAQIVQDWRGAMATPTVDKAAFLICDTFSLPVVAHYAGDRDVFINSSNGIWQMDEDDWRAIYGQPIAERLDKTDRGVLGEGVGQLYTWQEFTAEPKTIAFLKVDIFCNDGEAGRIRDHLAEAGYQSLTVQRHTGLRSEVFRMAD